MSDSSMLKTMHPVLLAGKCCHHVLVFLLGISLSLGIFAKSFSNNDVIFVSQLPKEAQQTLLLIKQGGPFPFDKDGAVFSNYETLLPKQKRGYYREFTVRTPGVH